MAQELTHFHRIQICRAQSFIKGNIGDKLSLNDIALEAGISKYHFIRVFSAYIGETPFEYIQRIKILKSFSLLNQKKSIAELSHEVGFESQSSFNKAFKKLTGISPKEFRNLGKDQQEAIHYNLGINPLEKESAMSLNLSEKPEVITRAKMEIFALKGQGGSFADIAPLVWQNFLNILSQQKQDLSSSEYLGLSYIESINQRDNHIYKVAISNPTGQSLSFKELEREVLPEQKYLKFDLKGSYRGVWPAFNQIFKYVSENSYELADGPCLENYLNDPSCTPEDELLTELLVPIKS
ncbi:Transposon Tn10 TetD protein [compost metagenome]